MRFSIEHILPISREEYWRILHTPEFEAFQAEKLGLKEYREIARKEENGVVYRQIQVVPRVEIPETALKIVRGYLKDREIGYIEHQEKYPDQFFLKFRIEPPVLKDKIRVEGTFSLLPDTEETCLRTLEGEVTVQLLGVGKIVERFVVDELKRVYDRIPQVIKEYRKM
jgi:hypothetical protein